MALLDGKVAIVTGAAGGIGSDTSAALAEQGARVVLTDLQEDRLQAVAQELRDKGHEVAAHVADITDEASVRSLVAFAVATFGGIDVVDNNAGATGQTDRDLDVVNMDLEVWERAIGINARGPLLVCKHAIPVMIDGGGGSIINISSGQSLSGDIANTAYSAGKAAVNSLTRDIATVYGPKGVRCNAVLPGLIVPAAAQEHFPAAFKDMFVDNCPVPRLGLPRDISNAVVFLASDLSAYITGQTLSVDGGFSAHLPTVAPMRALQAGWVSKADVAQDA
jgi:NAD(P)-dependent dehydrogenase (short-subunit alcohol dehydrogenase family)